MPAQTVDLTKSKGRPFEQGADYLLQLRIHDENGDTIDLTGYTARMQVRQTVDNATALINWSTSGGQITLNGASSPNLTVAVAAATTAAISWDGLAVYDIEIVSGSGYVYRVAEGKIECSKEVTR